MTSCPAPFTDPAVSAERPHPGSREVDIAQLTTPADAAAVVALQHAIWGTGDVAVPAGQLIAAAHAGGTVLLAHHAGRPVGFCYGFVGLDAGPSPHRRRTAATLPGGTPVMWSHMLGVLPAWRGRGVGRSLKLAQADRTRARGLTRILWTFDPLEARNARLNLHNLGAVAARYHVDRYGPMEDALNAGLPTDRLVADWDVSAAHATVTNPAHQENDEPQGASLLLNPEAPHGGVVGAATVAEHTGELSIAVPLDDWRAGREDALAWRANVRAAFALALEAGYVAVDLRLGDPLAAYRLVRR